MARYDYLRIKFVYPIHSVVIQVDVIGSSNLLYNEAEQPQEYNVEGLRPTTEIPQQLQTIDTTIGPISFNFNQSCLEPDQVPQNIRQSMSSLPNDSQFPLQPQENQSSMVKEKKKAVKKHVCPEQGCPKSITGYTQSHNLKDHMRKKHNSI